MVEVARQIRNAPDVTLGTYADVFEELDPAERVGAIDAIDAARADFDVSGARERGRRGDGVPHVFLKPTRGFEPRTPSLRAMISCRERSRLVAQSRMNPGTLRNLGGGRGPQLTRA